MSYHFLSKENMKKDWFVKNTFKMIPLCAQYKVVLYEVT